LAFRRAGNRGDFASPSGGKVVYDPYSDPYFKNSTESEDLVSKGFLSDKALVAKLESTLTLKEVGLSKYDAVHVAGGEHRCAAALDGAMVLLHDVIEIPGAAYHYPLQIRNLFP
jgi:putative intracellular protease/amidase